MQLIDELNRAIKYVTSKPEDFYSSIMGSADHTPSLMLADFLQEQDESHPLPQKIREEVRRQQEGHIGRPVRLGDTYPLHDFVFHAIRTGHPNPTVRAMAKMTEIGMPPHSDLLNLLFHSDRPEDQDSAVFLSPEDSTKSHSSHAQLKKLKSNALRDQGLDVKTVRGTVYLLDHNQQTHPNYGSPEIVFTSPVNDHSELAEMQKHAEQLAAQRKEMDGASMGEVHYS